MKKSMLILGLAFLLLISCSEKPEEGACVNGMGCRDDMTADNCAYIGGSDAEFYEGSSCADLGYGYEKNTYSGVKEYYQTQEDAESSLESPFLEEE